MAPFMQKITKVAVDSRAATNVTSTEIGWQLVKIVDTSNALIGLGLLYHFQNSIKQNIKSELLLASWRDNVSTCTN